jgi:hypothetical protein
VNYLTRKTTRIASVLMLLALTFTLQVAAAGKIAAAEAAAETTFGEHHYFGFEQSLKPWLSAAAGSVAASSLERVIGENGCYDLSGNAFANLKGTPATHKVDAAEAEDIPLPVGTWVVTSFQAEALNNVSVSFNTRNTAQCEGCIPMVYIGTTPPSLTTQFVQMDGLIKDYWQTYNHSETVYVGQKEALYVAIGWNGTSASIGLDCIVVDIFPFDRIPR